MKGDAKQHWRCVFEAFLTANKTPCEGTIPEVSFYCVVKELWINRNHREKDECYKWEVLEIGKEKLSGPPTKPASRSKCRIRQSHDWVRLWKWHLELLCARSRPLKISFLPSSLHLIRTGIPKHRVSASKQKWCISNRSHQFKTFNVMHIRGADERKCFSGRIKRFSAEESIGFHKNELQTFDLDPFWKLKSWWWSMRTDGWWFLPLNVSFGSITRTCIRQAKPQI